MPKKNYCKETVFIEDKVLSEATNIVSIGVLRREDEIHLAIFAKLPDGRLFHRDLEIQPDGSYDSGCLFKFFLDYSLHLRRC